MESSSAPTIMIQYPARDKTDALGSLVPILWELIGLPAEVSIDEKDGGSYAVDGEPSSELECLRRMDPGPGNEALDNVSSMIEKALKSSTMDDVLSWLNRRLVFRTYLSGYRISGADLLAFRAILNLPNLKVDPRKYRFAYRWYKHLDSDLDAIASRKVEVEIVDLDGDWDAVSKLVGSQGSWNVDLPGLVEGSVVTRFPPEPSGYLHIGHAKAALLNDFFARSYKGKLILRFDDTNPVKEKSEFEVNILADLDRLGVRPDRVEYASDYFDQLFGYADKMVRDGSAFVDKSSQETIKELRMARQPSPFRENSIEENTRLWEEMKQGTEEGKQCILRAKIDFSSSAGAMRDPTMYRFIFDVPHHRTGSKYFLYPLYDFACPVIDSLEGVTHALRSAEYSDREEQYYWFCDAAGVRKPMTWAFSRLNLTYTVMSKRKLLWFVEKGYADGWDDPRFPTVQGIRRRGLQIQALRAFILSQGASKNATQMEWDKIWTVNKRVIDPIAPRHTAIEMVNARPLKISNCQYQEKLVPKHKKNATIGTKTVFISGDVIIEDEDAQTLVVGEVVTLMDWGNVEIVDRKADGSLQGQFRPEDKDFRKTKKLTWLAQVPNLVPLILVKYKHLIRKRKIEEDDVLDGIINPRSKIEEECLGDPNLSELKKGDILQLERRGYFICDQVEGPMKKLIEIPDGRGKPEDQV